MLVCLQANDSEEQTHPNAAEAAQLGAVRAEPRIAQLLHTNKASEHLGDALEKGRRFLLSPPASHAELSTAIP